MARPAKRKVDAEAAIVIDKTRKTVNGVSYIPKERHRVAYPKASAKKVTQYETNG